MLGVGIFNIGHIKYASKPILLISQYMCTAKVEKLSIWLSASDVTKLKLVHLCWWTSPTANNLPINATCLLELGSDHQELVIAVLVIFLSLEYYDSKLISLISQYICTTKVEKLSVWLSASDVTTLKLVHPCWWTSPTANNLPINATCLLELGSDHQETISNPQSAIRNQQSAINI